MAQTYISDNLQKWAIGKQMDVAIASGGEATTATEFFSFSSFSSVNEPSPIMIEDAQGNKSTTLYVVLGDREFSFSAEGTTDITKIGRFIYYACGVVVSVQDGSTGAYKHTFTLLNNVILPKFTIFYNLGAEDYRRLKNCSISKITINVTDSEAKFSIEGMATGEDTTTNDSSTVASLGFTAVTYQTGTGLTRYTCAGTPTLSSVKNGDVLEVPAAITGMVNATNKGSFIVVSADNTGKTIDVINNKRTSATGDETGLTTGTTGLVHIVRTPAYPEPLAILLRRHSAVYSADDTSGLSSATAEGLRNFSFSINNNSAYIKERAKSAEPLAVFAKNITIEASFTQLMGYTSFAKANTIREGQAVQYAWRFELEDTSQYLGTSTSYRPLLRMTLPQALGIAARAGMGGNDELTYDWTLNASIEQSTEIVLQNTTASYS